MPSSGRAIAAPDRLTQSASVEATPRKLLILDASYTFEMIRERELEDSVTCRDLDGFFEHVWTVHPFATLLTSESWTPRYGRPVAHTLNDRHTFIEGKVGRSAWLKHLVFPNFLIGQVSIFLSLVGLIRREGVTAIRAGDPLYIGLFGWALARITRRPFVLRVGGNNDKMFETTGRPLLPRLFRTRRVEKLVERFVFPRADLVAGANQDNLDFALANGAVPERATLFRYGNLIDKRHLAPPAQRPCADNLLALLGLTARDGFLLYIGRLEPVKHPDAVVRVLASAVKAGHDVKALLVGDGSQRAALEALAVDLGVADRLVMPGNKDQGFLSLVIPRAAVVVSPHTGRALSEAALGEAPVVAYDVDWQGELIETGQTGILVSHGDVEALSQAALRLLGDRALATACGANLRHRAQEMLDPEALDAHEREQYRKVESRFSTSPWARRLARAR